MATSLCSSNPNSLQSPYSCGWLLVKSELFSQGPIQQAQSGVRAGERYLQDLRHWHWHPDAGTEPREARMYAIATTDQIGKRMSRMQRG
jgi:hypothetical protein